MNDIKIGDRVKVYGYDLFGKERSYEGEVIEYHADSHFRHWTILKDDGQKETAWPSNTIYHI